MIERDNYIKHKMTGKIPSINLVWRLGLGTWVYVSGRMQMVLYYQTCHC